MGGSSSGPSPEEIASRERAAAKKERERIALEEAKQSAFQDQRLQEQFAAQRSQRKSFVAQDEDETSTRRKFLKGV